MIFRKSVFLIISVLGLALMACDSDDEGSSPDLQLQVTFNDLGLDGRIVNELGFLKGELYAATDDGLYIKDLATDADWMEMGLQGKNTQAFLEIDQQTYLVSVTDPQQDNHQLYRSSNGGSNWNQLDNNFGGPYREAINDLTYNQQTNEVLASGNGVVATSSDNGQTWQPIYGDWQMVATGMDFVEVNPFNQDIWSGGQNGIEGFTLARFSHAENEWQDWINLLPSPSTAKDIAFDPTGSSGLIIGGEDGIIQSDNHGTSWKVIKEDHDARFYFGVDYDERIPGRIYATSWVKNFTDPQPLILFVSEDSGATWEDFVYPDADLLGGVWDMVQRTENSQTKLYVGLYKGGVFEIVIDN